MAMQLRVLGEPAASVLNPDDGIELDFPTVKGGVSLSTRSGPKAGFHSLPLTLSIKIETFSWAFAFFVSGNSGTSVIFSSPEGLPDSIL
jgi:hypothetical protein